MDLVVTKECLWWRFVCRHGCGHCDFCASIVRMSRKRDPHPHRRVRNPKSLLALSCASVVDTGGPIPAWLWAVPSVRCEFDRWLWYRVYCIVYESKSGCVYSKRALRNLYGILRDELLQGSAVVN